MKKIISKNKGLIYILILALTVRIAYLLIVNPPVAWYDSGIYDGLAWSLVNGNGYSTADMQFSVEREPGYSLFLLAPVYFLFGHSVMAVQWVQIILSIFTIVLVYGLAGSIFSKKVGLISSLMLAVYPPSIIYTGEVMTENFYTLVLFIATALFFWGSKNQEKKYIVWAGIVFGVASLIRINTVFIFTFLFFALWLTNLPRKRIAIYTMIVGLGIVLLVSPWVIRNYVRHDKFILGRVGLGVTLWSGSYIPWDGDWREPAPYKLPYFQERLKGVTGWFEADDIFLEEALVNIRNNPVGVMWIWAKKPFKILFIDEVSTYLYPDKLQKYEQLSFFDKFSKFITPLRYAFQVIHLSWIIPGLAMLFYYAVRKNLFALISLFTIFYVISTYIPMNAVPRYLEPLSPYIMIFTALGISKISLKSQAREKKV